MSDLILFLLSTLGLVISLYLLYFFSEYYFIPILDTIGKRLWMSSDIAGATLMAAGSSAPELAVVIVSIAKSGHHEAIGVGTIVGSALFNLFIIVGAVMILAKNAKFQWQPLIRDLLFYALSVILLVIFFRDGSINIFEALIFITSYAGYFIALYNWKKLFPYNDLESESKERDSTERINKVDAFLKRLVPGINNLYIAFFLIIIIITILSWILVESAINISVILNVPEVIVALTVIALGTSVPDLISSVIVTKQGRPGMAINNAIGSNIFDILIGLGLPLILLLLITSNKIEVSTTDLKLSFMLLMGSIIVLTGTLIINKWKAAKWIGYSMIIIYVVYLSYEISCTMGLPVCDWFVNW
jgi:K+-dependent Na+/Ca+ exchanger-like protein